MIAIALTFPAGRYHATPWGRHVNEGSVEWPPSPWRLLRSFVAAWKRTPPNHPTPEVEPALRALAATLPDFVLPAASTGHTRHYMPWNKDWKPPGPQKRTMVFDAFVSLDPSAEVVAIWRDAVLPREQRDVLAGIVANLGFLGRAESWCDARLLNGETNGLAPNCCVLMGDAKPSEEVVRVLCPHPTEAFANTKFTEPKRTVTYDPDWHLCAETLWLHKQRWSDPPGSRWVRYVRPADCFDIKARAPRRTPSARPRPQVVRFALDSTVLPLLTHTIPVAEGARRAVIRQLIDLRGRERYGRSWSREEHKAGRQPAFPRLLSRGPIEALSKAAGEDDRHAFRGSSAAAPLKHASLRGGFAVVVLSAAPQPRPHRHSRFREEAHGAVSAITNGSARHPPAPCHSSPIPQARCAELRARR